ncbi:O-methyltransferase [Hymenobacter sp. BT175]|uniref:O-methyltransferase n=1 Tax=Hymenobacter translucens TaxID=2886507 RepID=UPI001D0E2FAE|nr:O-methyltransferase [Hymenobacter translucens]MCC2546900.1 O-methyltransferase [Hymenobacter translucens]
MQAIPAPVLNSDDPFQLYAEAHTSPEPELLARLNRETHVQVLAPRMLSGHLQGRLLSMISHMVRPRRVLEIGTFTGYAALSLAEGLAPDGELHTIEQNPELETRIRRYVAAAGLEARLHLHIGDARQVLPTLAETWDLVFIDADKINNDRYYELVLPRVRPGGFILVDNVLWGGKVVDSYPVKPSDKDTHAVRAFNDKVQADARVENVFLPLRDGLFLVRKR